MWVLWVPVLFPQRFRSRRNEMEQLVRVKETYDDGTALVIHVRESACSGDCHKCSGCGAAKEAVLFSADNPIGARRGDLVKVESDTGTVLKAAVVLYVIPLVLFFLGYWLGDLMGSLGTPVACLGFALGVVIVVIYDRKVVRKQNIGYTITAFAGDALLQAMRKEGNHHG